jgi:hypothetical protein
MIRAEFFEEYVYETSHYETFCILASFAHLNVELFFSVIYVRPPSTFGFLLGLVIMFHTHINQRGHAVA